MKHRHQALQWAACTHLFCLLSRPSSLPRTLPSGHLLLRSLLSLRYAARTGVEYAYKMRMRTDLLFLQRLPPPRSIDFGTTGAPFVHAIPNHYCPTGLDKFAFGKTAAMDVYLDRYPTIHTMPALATIPRWGSESFMLQTLKTINATIKFNEGFNAGVVRNAGFERHANRSSPGFVGRRRVR